MSKKDQYGLEFYKINPNNNKTHNCRRKNGIVDQNNDLQFLNDLDVSKTEFLLREINSYFNTTPDPNWTTYESMVLEHIELSIEYPNFRIGERPYTFLLTDIRDLLQEWLVFLQS
ncbi:hypothetical protein [Flavobacterium sp.]|uniref:hypothetical protein n=1 Tax=Flavobacterium sp. TaxID=239 RepID=UPI0039E66B2A